MYLEYYESDYFKSFAARVKAFIEENSTKRIALYGSIDSFINLCRRIDNANLVSVLIGDKRCGFTLPFILLPEGAVYYSWHNFSETDFDYAIATDFFNLEVLKNQITSACASESKFVNLFDLDKMQIPCSRYGLKWELDLRNRTELDIISGHYEDNSVLFWKSILRPGDNAVDAGANIGLYTLLGSRAVEKNGSIISIEPSLAMNAKMQRHIELNNLSNIHRYNVFAEKVEGQERDFCDYDWYPSQSIFSMKSKVFQKIVTKSIDSMVRENKLDSLRAIKIDVDGTSYFNVVESAATSIRQLRPYVFMEFFKKEALAEKHTDLLKFFMDLGYDVYSPEMMSFPVPVKHFLRMMPDCENYIFVPEAMA